MLTGAGLERVWHHSRAHRFFALARWSADAVGLASTDLIVARLLPAESPLTIAVDDTLFKRSGKKVFGAAWHHDGAAKGPKPIGFGHCSPARASISCLDRARSWSRRSIEGVSSR
jgi:hypothetical protein